MKIARFSLLRMNRFIVRKRNWRPILLLFVKDISERIELVNLAAAFGQNRGIFTISKLIFSTDETSRKQKKKMKEEMIKKVNSIGLEAFCEVDEVESLNRGILNISRGHGIAGFKSNTIMFGWSEEIESNINQLKIIRALSKINKNIIVAKFNDHENWKVTKHQRIDVWWSGADNNRDLMLILSYMLTLNPEWKQSRIHVREVIDYEKEWRITTDEIKESLKEARIQADVEVIVKGKNSFPEILSKYSSDADIVMLGLKVTEKGEEISHAEKIEQLSQAGKVCVFVQNNSLEETFPVLLKSGNRKDITFSENKDGT